MDYGYGIVNNSEIATLMATESMLSKREEEIEVISEKDSKTSEVNFIKTPENEEEEYITPNGNHESETKSKNSDAGSEGFEMFRQISNGGSSNEVIDQNKFRFFSKTSETNIFQKYANESGRTDIISYTDQVTDYNDNKSDIE